MPANRGSCISSFPPEEDAKMKGSEMIGNGWCGDIVRSDEPAPRSRCRGRKCLESCRGRAGRGLRCPDGSTPSSISEPPQLTVDDDGRSGVTLP